jgi:hypothetical protein
MATHRVVVEWQDANLGWLRTSWNQVPGSTGAAILAAILAHSNAGVGLRSEGDLVVVNGAATNAIYPLLTDVAQIEFCTAARNIVRLQIPAPKQNIFYAGGNYKEVDLSTIADLRAAALGTLADPLGNPVAMISGGTYSSRKRDQV